MGGYRPSGMWVVQLGAFNTPRDANTRWEQLQNTHNDLLGHLQPRVSSPGMSSGRTSVFYLRTGPYVNRVGALDLCDALKARHMGCAVVQER